MEDDDRTGRPTIVRTEPKIVEIATFERASRSQSVDDIATVVQFSKGMRHKILPDYLNISRVTQHWYMHLDARSMCYPQTVM